jgi:hypothetical protein
MRPTEKWKNVPQREEMKDLEPAALYDQFFGYKYKKTSGALQRA